MNTFTAFSIVLQVHGNRAHSIWQARPGSVSSDPTSLVLSKNQTTRALSTYKFGSSFGFVRSKTSEIGLLCRLIFLEKCDQRDLLWLSAYAVALVRLLDVLLGIDRPLVGENCILL